MDVWIVFTVTVCQSAVWTRGVHGACIRWT